MQTLKRSIFLILVTIEAFFSLDRRFFAPHHMHTWAIFLDSANDKLWPEYDGEGWLQLFN